jgi:hypothetical protein
MAPSLRLSPLVRDVKIIFEFTLTNDRTILLRWEAAWPDGAHVVRAFDFRLADGQTKEEFLLSKRDTFTLSLPKLDMVFLSRPTGK